MSLQKLRTFLRPRQSLLLLDTCEHLLAGCASLVDTLLRHCPHVRVLATSREVLSLAGEATLPPPLRSPRA